MKLREYLKELFSTKYRIVEYVYANSTHKYMAQYRKFLKWRHIESTSNGIPMYDTTLDAQSVINKYVDDKRAAIEEKRGRKVVDVIIYNLHAKL